MILLLKIDLYYLASALENTNDKADNFLKKEVDCVQLITHFASLNNA